MNNLCKKITKICGKADVIHFNKSSKFIIMSDCHRGYGNNGDNFLPNSLLFCAAMEYYLNEGFTYIELGDGDELWENRNIDLITEVHSEPFRIMSEFYKKNRLYMLYGNHDIVKSCKKVCNCHYNSYYSPANLCQRPLFPGIKMHEGLVLQNESDENKILLIHGHQGSFLNDEAWRAARFLVRYVWKPLELVGIKAPVGTAGSYSQRSKTERKFTACASKLGLIIIAGHTHKPVFPAPGEGMYFNDGSCVHPMYITGIEIENNTISLVKWSVCIRKDRSMYICRTTAADPVSIEAYYR